MNNMNIPNLIGSYHFDNEKSALQRSMEMEYNKKNKRMKITLGFAISSLILSMGLFLMENNTKNFHNYQQNNINTFLVKNHNNYPVMKSDIQAIIEISKINQEIIKYQSRIEPLINDLESLTKSDTIMNTVTPLDKIRVIQMRNFYKFLLLHKVSEQEFQNLKMLGVPENTHLQKQYNHIMKLKSMILENASLNHNRHNALSKMIADLNVQQHYNSAYWWLAIITFFVSVILSGVGVWLYISNEKQRIANQHLEIMQENLNIASLVNTIMEMDVNNITKIPETDGITGNLINSINILFNKIHEKNNNNNQIISQLNHFKLDISLDKKFSQESILFELQETQKIVNDIIHYSENQNNDSIDFSEIEKELLAVCGTIQSYIEIPEINLDDISSIITEINELDQDLMVVVQNLEIFAQNMNGSHFNNVFAVGIMKDKLPITMTRKFELNERLEKAIKSKLNIINKYKQKQISQKQSIQSVIQNIQDIVQKVMIISQTHYTTNSNHNKVQQQVDNLIDKLNHIQLNYTQLIADFNNKEKIINSLIERK